MPPAKTTRKRGSPKPETTEEVVRIAKKDGPTKFQQMRKFLQKANEADKPVDLLAGYLTSRSRTVSPSRRDAAGYCSPGSVGRASVGSLQSPRMSDFHTGLTPTASSRRQPFPEAPVFVNSRRESDDGFAASDLLLQDGKSVNNRIGTFIHGQRGVNLRRKMNSKETLLARADSVGLALMLEEIPNVAEVLSKQSKDQHRRRVLLNTAEDDSDLGKENHNGDLDDSQLADLETEFAVGI